MDPNAAAMDHAFLAKLIGGTYALTLGSYIFTWLGLNRYDEKLEKIRENHIVHLKEEVAALAKRVEEMDAVTKRLTALETTPELESELYTSGTSPQ